MNDLKKLNDAIDLKNEIKELIVGENGNLNCED